MQCPGCGHAQGVQPRVCVLLSCVRRMASPSPVSLPVLPAVCLVGLAPFLSLCQCSWDKDIGSLLWEGVSSEELSESHGAGG